MGRHAMKGTAVAATLTLIAICIVMVMSMGIGAHTQARAQEHPDFDLPELVLPEFEPVLPEPLPLPEPIEMEPMPVDPAPGETADTAPHPSDIYSAEKRKVSDIETLSYSDLEGAKAQARDLKTELASRREVEQASAESYQRRADGWNELADGSEADADKNRQRADDILAGTNASLTDEEKTELRRQAEFWRDLAAGDDKRAQERRAEASKQLKEGEVFRDRMALLDDLIARLDKVLAREPEDDKLADSGSGDKAGTDTRAEEPVRADYEMGLGQSLGIWRPDDAQDEVMVVVQKTPDTDSRALELHTADRVWQGLYHDLGGSGDRATEPRLTFSYIPKAEEMNPEIPDAARKAVEGDLVWRIEAFESGSAANPALAFNFFRGRVRWKDDAPQEARVDGDGPPKRFEARQDTVLATRLAAPTLLFVRLANKRHDPSLRSLEAITRGMPLIINVVTSGSSAKEIGSSLAVDVTSESGGSTKLTLTRQRVTPDNRVIYGHSGVITIGGDAPEREYAPFAAPPRRIYGWIVSALGVGEVEPGPRLSVLPDNGDEVEFRYGDASQRFPVYATWVQRAVAQYEEQMTTMAATYGGVLASSQPEAIKAEARDRLRMLANYQRLSQSEHLTDLHRMAIAEAYLGRPNGRRLLAFSKTKLEEIHTTVRRGEAAFGEPDVISSATWMAICGTMSSKSYALSLQAPEIRGRAATSEEIGDAIQREALAALGHTGINAVKALDEDGLDWVHTLERQCLDRVLVRVSRNLLNRALKDYGTSLAFGLYEGIAMASGADDIAIAFFETDIHGNKVPQYSLPWWVSTLSVAVEWAGALDEVVTLGRKNVDADIWRAAARNVADDVSWSDALIDKTMKQVTRYFPTTPAIGKDVRTIIRRADGAVEELPELAEDALDALPASLTPAQKKQTVTDLIPLEEVDEVMPAAAKPRYTDQVREAGDPLGSALGTGLHNPGTRAYEINPQTGVANWYGNDAKPLGNLGADFCQIGNEHACEGLSAAYMIFQEEKLILNEGAMHGEMLRAFVQRKVGQGFDAATATRAFIDAGFGHFTGYRARDIAYYLRSRGYEVHAFNPARRGRYSLAMLQSAIQKGYKLRVGIRKPGQIAGGHAVVVQSIVEDRFGRIKDVVFFCPTQGGLLKMKASNFERWMIQNMDYDVVYAMRRVNPPVN